MQHFITYGFRNDSMFTKNIVKYMKSGSTKVPDRSKKRLFVKLGETLPRNEKVAALPKRQNDISDLNSDIRVSLSSPSCSASPV